MDKAAEQLEGTLHATTLFLLVALDEIAHLRAQHGEETVQEARRGILDSVRSAAPGVMARFEYRGRPSASAAFEATIEEFADKLMRFPAKRRGEG